MAAKTVGFDRVIRRYAMDRALSLAHEDVDVETARTRLGEWLEGAIASASSRQKSAGILRSIWLDPPDRCRALRDEALAIDDAAEDDDAAVGSTTRLALHWGMAMAAYPFVGVVAETTGRLLRLQESVSLSGIRRRVQESYGDRPTVNKAVPCVLRSFEDWGVLDSVGDTQFAAVSTYAVSSTRLAGWLLEATLHARRTEADNFQTLLAAPQLFPFPLSVHTADELPPSERRMIQRQGRSRDVLVVG
jgi:hypothetical protein